MPENNVERGRQDLFRPTRRARMDRQFAWWLVWWYPPAFRRSVGLALAEAIEDGIAERRAHGASTFAAWMPSGLDTLRNASAAWCSAAGPTDATHSSHATRTHLTDETRGAPEAPSMMDKLIQDVRYALRLWRRRPAFAIVAILTLAIGVGANTAMFSIVNAVILRPLPYPHAAQLVSVWGRTAAYPRGLISYSEFDALREQSGSLDSVALYFPQSVNLTGEGEPQRLIGIFASGTFFDLLGLRAERGRLFTENESTPEAPAPVVVITHALWRQRFNEAPAAVGSSITVNGTPLTIVGVLAAPFDADTVPNDGYFINGDMFIPAALFPTPNGVRSAGPFMLGLARAKTSLAAVNADLDVVSRRLAAADPNTQTGRVLNAESAQESIVGTSRPALLLLWAAVGAVLLIACVNVCQLLLARATERERELAVRAALGAGRSQITRQLAVEAGLLALAATAVGLVLAQWCVQVVAALRPPSVPIPTRVALDRTVLLFTGCTALAVAAVCALAPALRSWRDLTALLQAAGRRTTGRGRRTRELLVIVETALSVALVAVCALLVQSLSSIQRAPLGFDAAHVFTLQFRLPPTKYRSPKEIARFFKNSIERVRAVPGVESAALVRAVPFSGNGGAVGYAVEGRPAGDPASAPQARFHLVTPDYFRTLRIPVLKGRDFTDRDDLQSPLVAVVNDTFARRAWPGEEPLGKRITTPQTKGPITIVGVVGDAKHYTATEPPMPQLYASHYQVPLIFSSLVARTAVDPMSVTKE